MSQPIRWSSLKHIGVSPKHYRYRLEHPRPDTDALRFGRAVHCLVYEPDQFEERFPVMPRFHGGMKDETARERGYDGGREAKAAWLAKHGDSENALDSETVARAVLVRDAIYSDPIAGPIFTGGYVEQRITWTDPETGLDCAGTPDCVNGRLTDLKTARSVEPREFRNAAARYGYYAQIAWYLDGLRENGIVPDLPPALVAVEKEGPYDVVVYELSEADLRAGRAVYRRYLDALRDCLHTDRWPGVAAGSVLPLDLPEWAAGMDADQAASITVGGVPMF